MAILIIILDTFAKKSCKICSVTNFCLQINGQSKILSLPTLIIFGTYRNLYSAFGPRAIWIFEMTILGLAGGLWLIVYRRMISYTERTNRTSSLPIKT